MARICWGCSTVCFNYTVLWFKWSVKKHCVTKVLLAIWEMFFDENNCNCNSYRCGYKFAFILFFVLSCKTKTRIKFWASWWSGNEKYCCFLFIASRGLLQSHAKFNKLLYRNFLACYSCSYYSSTIEVLKSFLSLVTCCGKKRTGSLFLFFSVDQNKERVGESNSNLWNRSKLVPQQIFLFFWYEKIKKHLCFTFS